MRFARLDCEYKRMTIWSAPFPASKDSCPRLIRASKSSSARGAAVAAHGSRNDLSDAGGRRCDTADRIRSFDRRMETGHRRAAAALGKRVAGRVHEIPGHSAISRTQSRYGPRCIQSDLLVGMVTPAAGAPDRRRIPPAISIFPVARRHSAKTARSIVGHFLRRRRSRRGGVVDGLFGSLAGRERLAIPPGLSSHAGQRDLRGDPVDGAAARGRKVQRRRRQACALARLSIAVLLLLQIYLGALVAGLDAGLVFNTWPLIDGSLVPSAERLWFIAPAWRNLFENALTVQFDHRMVAYAVWLLAILHACDAFRGKASCARRCHSRRGGNLAGGDWGSSRCCYQAPIPLALAHQMLAIVVFSIAVIHAEQLSHRMIVYAPQTTAAEQNA